MNKLILSKIYPVSCHTNHIGKNSIFVSIQGEKENGLKYINAAIKKGATKIVVNKKFKSQILKTSELKKSFNDIEYIFTDNARKALAILSAQRLNNPSSKLKIIGVTGTKGKTSTTYIINHILQSAGFDTAIIGTIKNQIKNKEVESTLTTPQSDFLQMFFNECVKEKVDYVIMEISSHALSLDRVHNVQFDAIGFTNLQPEHLDFYPSINEYFKAKYSIFEHSNKKTFSVINSDDKWGKKAIEMLNRKKHLMLMLKNVKIISFSKNKSEKTNFKITKNNLSGLNIEIKTINQNLNLNTPKLFGLFNAYNITMASLICLNLGIEKEKIKSALTNFEGIQGRLQMHKLKKGSTAFVDYAHNPSSVEAVLKTLKKLNKKIITVFGCGGDRDKIKRPVMGKLASELSDYIIITNDNPRSENPQKIAVEILNGISKKYLYKVKTILNRKTALEHAVSISDKDSIIAILGKGHENYYLIKDKKLYFDDFEEISRF